MKTIIVPSCRSHEIKHQHPDRTSVRSFSVPFGSPRWGDVEFKTWNCREAMARAIRMQQSRASKQDDWRAIVPLTDCEGY